MQDGSSTSGWPANGSPAAVLMCLNPCATEKKQLRYGKPIAEPVYEDESDDSPNPFGEIGCSFAQAACSPWHGMTKIGEDAVGSCACLR